MCRHRHWVGVWEVIVAQYLALVKPQHCIYYCIYTSEKTLKIWGVWKRPMKIIVIKIYYSKRLKALNLFSLSKRKLKVNLITISRCLNGRWKFDSKGLFSLAGKPVARQRHFFNWQSSEFLLTTRLLLTHVFCNVNVTLLPLPGQGQVQTFEDCWWKKIAWVVNLLDGSNGLHQADLPRGSPTPWYSKLQPTLCCPQPSGPLLIPTPWYPQLHPTPWCPPSAHPQHYLQQPHTLPPSTDPRKKDHCLPTSTHGIIGLREASPGAAPAPQSPEKSCLQHAVLPLKRQVVMLYSNYALIIQPACFPTMELQELCAFTALFLLPDLWVAHIFKEFNDRCFQPCYLWSVHNFTES